MNVENNPQLRESAGLLDKAVRLVTLGNFGVDNIVAHGLMDGFTGDVFQGSPVDYARRIGNVVVVNDMSKERHIVGKKIVRRKP